MNTKGLTHTPAPQINVAAFSAQYDVPIGSQNLPEGTPWVDEIAREDLQKEFEGWGNDVATLLRFMPEKTIRLSVHVVDPPLESYARGRVALLGDAVRSHEIPAAVSRDSYYDVRPMPCFHISELAHRKVSRTPYSSFVSLLSRK